MAGGDVEKAIHMAQVLEELLASDRKQGVSTLYETWVELKTAGRQALEGSAIQLPGLLSAILEVKKRRVVELEEQLQELVKSLNSAPERPALGQHTLARLATASGATIAAAPDAQRTDPGKARVGVLPQQQVTQQASPVPAQACQPVAITAPTQLLETLRQPADRDQARALPFHAPADNQGGDDLPHEDLPPDGDGLQCSIEPSHITRHTLPQPEHSSSVAASTAILRRGIDSLLEELRTPVYQAAARILQGQHVDSDENMSLPADGLVQDRLRQPKVKQAIWGTIHQHLTSICATVAKAAIQEADQSVVPIRLHRATEPELPNHLMPAGLLHNLREALGSCAEPLRTEPASVSALPSAAPAKPFPQAAKLSQPVTAAQPHTVNSILAARLQPAPIPKQPLPPAEDQFYSPVSVTSPTPAGDDPEVQATAQSNVLEPPCTAAVVGSHVANDGATDLQGADTVPVYVHMRKNLLWDPANRKMLMCDDDFKPQSPVWHSVKSVYRSFRQTACFAKGGEYLGQRYGAGDKLACLISRLHVKQKKRTCPVDSDDDSYCPMPTAETEPHTPVEQGIPQRAIRVRLDVNKHLLYNMVTEKVLVCNEQYIPGDPVDWLDTKRVHKHFQQVARFVDDGEYQGRKYQKDKTLETLARYFVTDKPSKKQKQGPVPAHHNHGTLSGNPMLAVRRESATGGPRNRELPSSDHHAINAINGGSHQLRQQEQSAELSSQTPATNSLVPSEHALQQLQRQEQADLGSYLRVYAGEDAQRCYALLDVPRAKFLLCTSQYCPLTTPWQWISGSALEKECGREQMKDWRATVRFSECGQYDGTRFKAHQSVKSAGLVTGQLSMRNNKKVSGKQRVSTVVEATASTGGQVPQTSVSRTLYHGAENLVHFSQQACTSVQAEACSSKPSSAPSSP